MKRPEVIEKEIKILKEQLKKSKEYYNYTFVCNNCCWGEDLIGPFNLRNIRKILTLLNEGKILQLKHSVYGNVHVQMNPQQNRIIVDDNENINEDNIFNFMVLYPCEWWCKND